MIGDGRDRRTVTDAQWAREIDRRVSRLEQPNTLRIGEWVLSVRDGDVWLTTAGRAINLTPVILAAAGATRGRMQRVIQLLGSPAGGTWELVYDGLETNAALSRTATATAVLNAILALDPSYTTLDFTVTGTNGGPWTFTGPAASLEGDGGNLTGGTNPSVDIQPL